MAEDDDDNIEEFSEEAKNFLSTLTPSEAQVLRERFNIDMASGKSPINDLQQLKKIQNRIQEVKDKVKQKNEQSE